MSEFCLLLIVLAILATPVLLVVLIIRAIKKKPIEKVAIGLACCVGSILPLTIIGAFSEGVTISHCEHDMIEAETGLICSLCGYTENEEGVESTFDTESSYEYEVVSEAETETSHIEEVSEVVNDSVNDWKTTFSSKGFTDDEISRYDEILTNVGITDYHDVEIIENGFMHIVRGKIYDSNVLQLNMTLENREIIVITLAGIPDYESEAYINWRGKLKFKQQKTTRSIDLFYDMDGGYVAKFDWENMMITPYAE